MAAMPNNPFIQTFALIVPEKPATSLEARVNQLFESEKFSENLDAPQFAKMTGSESKADWLLGQRLLVGEMKTLNGDPADRVEKRLQERMAQPGAPIVFGRFGIGPVVDALDDRDQVLKQVHDVSGRAVRRHLAKSNEQIGNTKKLLSLPDARGLTIMMNEQEKMIDSANVGYTIKTCFEAQDYENIDYVWVSIEAHHIKIPGAGLGYPQLIVFKEDHEKSAKYLTQMLAQWTALNGGRLVKIDHKGDWGAIQPVYFDGPPVLSAY